MRTLPSILRIFFRGAGALLLAAALERFLLAAGDSQVLALPDVVLGIPVRTALLLVGSLELLVALVCLFGKAPGIPAVLLTWLLASGVTYRLGLVYLGGSARCTCLGRFADPLHLVHLANGWPEKVLAMLPDVLLAGAGIALVAVFLLRRRPDFSRTFVKVACPGCGGHIQLPAEGVGLKIACPHCGGGLHPQTLPSIP